MTDIETLTKKLLANFRTIRIPTEPFSTPSNSPPGDWWWTMAKARRAEKRAICDRRDSIRRVLNRHRQPFLDYLEPDPESGWRLHIFVLDDAGLVLLDGIDGEHADCGDPVEFDPEKFIIERLRELDWYER
jgi:hypothetical protein